MATFKVTIKKKEKRNDGTVNVKIRVTHYRAARYAATEYYACKNILTRSMKRYYRVVSLIQKMPIRPMPNYRLLSA